MRVAVLFVLSLSLAIVSADRRCKVSRVHAVCEARCEQDTRPVDSTVPPAGTLLPPAVSLLEVEEQLEPAVTITKTKNGKFLAENVPKATNHVAVLPGMSDVKSARMMFADRDVQNLNEVGTSHFGQLEAPSSLLHPPMTCEDVEQHINPVPLLSWVDVKRASFGCADGRSADEGLGTWGGDFGEMVTALNIYEQMATIHLTQAEVTAIFRKYLQATNREAFSTCISSLAVRQLFGTAEDMENSIRNPPEDKKAALWMKIADPNYVGNEHVKFMLENPAGYSVRKELVQHLIHSFYDILWNPYDPLRNKLRVQMLVGEHTERAVVAVTSPDFCLKQAGLAPLIAPRLSTSSVIILNPDAVQTMRREMSVFFSRATSPVVRSDEMNKRFNVLAAGQGALTKKTMFDRIPTYSAKISE